MADIVGEIIIGPTDVDLLTCDRISAVTIGFRFTAQRTHIAACMRLGQVHGAVPFARNELWQIERLDLVAGMMFQRFDLALGHQRVQLDR